MTNNKTIYVGDKFYIIKGETAIILRVVKINNSKVTVVTGDKKFNISCDDLLKYYIKLKPHGSLFFSIVDLQAGNKDVIVSFFRREDEGKIPYAVCRQNIENVFMSKAKLMNAKQVDENFYLGLSMSQDTCPEDIPFDMMLACNGVNLSHRVDIYLDDTFEDILSLVPKIEKYDAILKNLHDKVADYNLVGCQKSLEDLMKETIFMQDLMNGFGIHILNETIIYNNETLELIPEQRKQLENELNVEMFRTYVIPYDYSINIYEIKRSYVLVKDNTETLYVVAYDKGEYINKDMKKDFRDRLDLEMKMRK